MSRLGYRFQTEGKDLFNKLQETQTISPEKVKPVVDKPKGFTIQLKLMGIISILFILTVTVIIMLATQFFRPSP